MSVQLRCTADFVGPATGVADSKVFGLAPEFALLSGPRGARFGPATGVADSKVWSHSSRLLEQCDVFVAFAEDLIDVAAEPVEACGEHQPRIELWSKIAVKEVAGVE